MEKITYKEFEKIIHDMGYTISPDYEVNVMVVTNEGEPLLNISKCAYKSLNLDCMTFKKLPDNDKEILADASWALASTPLLDREEPKKYQLRLKALPPGQGNDTLYLNILKDKTDESRLAVGVRRRIPQWELPWRNEFTDKQIDELNRDYNVLAFYKKVEVEDEELA